MPEETPIPIPPAPLQTPQADDTSRQLAALGDAMRQLAESQKTLIDVVTKSTAAAPAPQNVTRDVTGDPGAGGARPAAMVDYSKLSPLQQITVGLRDAKPQGPVALRRARDPVTTGAGREEAPSAANGAD